MRDKQTSQSCTDRASQAISGRVIVGVIGHHKLETQPALIQGIRLAVEQIRQMVPSLRNTPFIISILSSLAEGTDRIVVREILKANGSMLDVVFPLNKGDYLKEFETSESVEEFENLLAQASSVSMLPFKGNRTEAYKQAGRYIVDHCDILLALWDGEPIAAQDGVAETVHYARETDCPLVWIHTREQYQVTVESVGSFDPRPLQDLDKYNSERVDFAKFEKQIEDQSHFFLDEANRLKLSINKLRDILKYFLSHGIRSDLLALRYKNLYYRAESLIYALALAAIATAAFQILFAPDRPKILIIEVVFMLAALAIVGIGRRQGWHAKWIDYRFLAERLHSALFMALANTDAATLRPPRHLSLSYSSKDWMVAAFSSVWSSRPQLQYLDSSALEQLRHFLGEVWVEDQIRYHNSASKHHHQRHKIMSNASNILFGLTICVAILHVVNIGPHLLESTLAFMAIIFPALAASITAVRTHRDHLRNSMRSAEMVAHLKELKDEMMVVEDLDSLHRLLKEIEQTMLHENEDWRVVVRFHEPELPA